jgi:hypothetical protein
MKPERMQRCLDFVSKFLILRRENGFSACATETGFTLLAGRAKIGIKARLCSGGSINFPFRLSHEAIAD